MESPIIPTSETINTPDKVGYRLVQQWTPNRDWKKELSHKLKAKKHRELYREFELSPSGKYESLSRDVAEQEEDEILEKPANFVTPETCLETARNVLNLLEQLPSEDPTVTDLLLQCPKIKAHLVDFMTRVNDESLLEELVSQYDRILLVC